MFEFSHIVSLMLFIVIGGIGMASMQDGLGIVFRRMVVIFRASRVRDDRVALPARHSVLTD
ncbi:hypothetical protein [Kordiimonas gwangyangensis]|uniref:hypothetical protein n=1 Tax=Kordiimonas gwangyangensis TaxID=288022 RepID=UPI00036826D9|nr:hypothetical protein [Kordiimonas gwangyangensis]